MKTQVRGASVTQGFDAFQSNAFTIAVNNKSFRVLLDTLYTNKVRAAIRELWTNAFDAHIEAGIPDTPFECYLPSALAPTFTVRDYGVSMTHEQTMHLYTGVFRSTKEDSNEQVGCLGLGSKSPFAYTDAFTVRRYSGGEEQEYLCAIGSEGVPTITAFPAIPSEEQRGLQVSFPVEAHHFREFKEEATHVAAGFDTPPITPGHDFARAEAVLCGPGWRVIEGHQNSIRMGCVIYPVTEFQLRVATGLNYKYGLIVDVPIGTVDIAANREALSLDDLTVARTKDAFETAASSVKQTAIDYIEGAKDLFEAQQRWVEMLSMTGRLSSITYNGTVLNGFIEFKDGPTTPALCDFHEKKLDKVAFPVNGVPELQFVVDHGVAPKVPRKRTRYRAFREAYRYRKSHLYIIKEPTPQQLAALVRRLKLKRDQIISMSALPDVVITRSPRGKAENIPGIYTTAGRNYHTVREVEDDFLWVPIERITADVSLLAEGLGCYTNTGLFQIISAAAIQMGETRPVYYLTGGAQKRLKVTETNAFVSVFKTWLDGAKAAILAEHSVALTVEALQAASRSWLSEMVVNALCADLHTSAYDCQQHGGDFTEKLLTKELSETHVTAAQAANEIQESFPLLFTNGSDSDIISYINQKRD